MARIRPPVLRHWLQSSALVAVLAGYGLLLSAGSLLSTEPASNIISPKIKASQLSQES